MENYLRAKIIQNDSDLQQTLETVMNLGENLFLLFIYTGYSCKQ